MPPPFTSPARWLAPLLLPAVLAVLAGCAGPSASSQPGGPAPVTSGPFGKDPVVTIPNASPPHQLIVETLLPGRGPPVLAGDTVTVQDTGAVWKSGKVFDSTWLRGFPESFVLGSGQVLPGWENGLGGLPAGSRVLLVIPPALGYGPTGDAPYVGSSDTLVFVIDIVSALPPGL